MYIKSKNSYYNPYLPIYYREYGAQLECDFGDQLEFDKKKNEVWLNVDWGHMCVVTCVCQEQRMGVGVLLTTSSKLRSYFSLNALYLRKIQN